MDSQSKYMDDGIINMLEFLMIDNIFVMFGEQIFQQTIGIPMETNCAPLLADLLNLELIQSLLPSEKKTTAKSFNFTHRYR